MTAAHAARRCIGDETRTAAPTILAALVLLLGATFTPVPARAAGEELMDAIMRSDFVFDRNISNAPFMPIAFLSATDFGRTRSTGDCSTSARCTWRQRKVEVSLGAPAWVGKQDMVLLGGSLSLDEFENATGRETVVGGGVLAGWVRQVDENWQVGSFAYPYAQESPTDGGRTTHGFVGGAVARYRHRPELHTYFGAVAMTGEPDGVLVPYLGVDWYPSRNWVVSVLAPWPSVTWAPSTEWMLRVGGFPSGSGFQFEDDGEAIHADLSRFSLGLEYELRLLDQIWGGFGVGVSGLARARLLGSDLDYEVKVDNEPFARLFLHFRP